MSELTYYWHDYETFGANPRLDRPCQFAGQRTDAELNPIGDPLMIYSQPTDDFLPHPQACLITGITPQIAEERGEPEPVFIQEILDELSRPGTCSVGYNSLRFDDEVTRHTLWRNFHDPYAREWQNGCSRWDIIDMVRLTYALRPEGIEWPLREDGQPSFRLEDLAGANGLVKERAHDALSDVHTTIALARLIRDKQPKLYDYVTSNRDKQSARSMLGLNEYMPVLHVSSKFPAAQGCLSLVMPLAEHPTNKNAVLVFDLRQDPGALLELSPEDIHERIFTPRADLPEDVERIAVKAVHANKCPILVPVKTINDAQAERLQLNLPECRERWKAIRPHVDVIAAKLHAVFEMGEFEANSDAEQDLYGGFVGNADRKLCDQIRRMSGPELASDTLVFEDRRLNELLFRYRARHFPDDLNSAEQDEWQRWRSKRIEFAPDGGISLDEYRQLIELLKQEHASEVDKLGILTALEDWALRISP
ncbi:MAG: exodeoxyribonuclease I [Nevskiales bacterium]